MDICLVMIVRDETPVIKRCIDSVKKYYFKLCNL